MNINNNTAPFVSTTWHLEEPLGCAVYSHCPTNDLYNKFIHGCCLPSNYVAKPFGILQRVIKIQRVLVSPFIWTQQNSISFLSEKFVTKFSGYLKEWLSKKNFRTHTSAQFSRKKCCFFFVHVRKCSHTSNCTRKLSHTLSDGFTS